MTNSEIQVKIHFDRDWQNITDRDIQDWKEAYPAVNVGVALKQMRQWLLANPAKAHKKQWRRFIINWLGREQERSGGMARTENSPTKPVGSIGYCFVCRSPANTTIGTMYGAKNLCDTCQRLLKEAPPFVSYVGKTIAKHRLSPEQLESMILKQKAAERINIPF